MNSIFIMAGYDMDTGMLWVMFSDGSTANYSVDAFENSLKTTLITRSRLDWMLENDVFTYARLMITGKMQEYLDDYAKERSSVRNDVEAQLRKTCDDATAAYLAREFMMYES